MLDLEKNMDKVFPKLYEQSSTGKIKHWLISVFEDGKKAVITVAYGAGDSKIRITNKDITEGRNIGRSNESTPFEQAVSEAESTWKKKQDKGYVKDIKDLSKEVLLPMLAHPFQKRGHNISYPAYVQPKLDGIRCLAKKIDSKTIKYYSRMGKEFTTLEHLTPELLSMFSSAIDGQILDGEIYSHDMTFQEMIRLVKKLRPESSKLKFHVFDIVDTDSSFDIRYAELKGIFGRGGGNNVVLVKAERIGAESEISDKHSEYIKDGYEGLMIRNVEGVYKLKGRSADLQKYKEFQDEEFIIIGGKESTGSEVGCIIFDVKNSKGQEFAVRPRGSFEQRKVWMKDIDTLIGKKLTVRYQELTDDGIPRFPVGISIRDYEG